MGIAIPFGFPRLPVKPNRDSFLRLQTLCEAQSQFIFASPGTPGSQIAIHFFVSRHSGKQNRNSFLRLRTLWEAKSQFIFASPDTPGSKIEIHFGLPETP